MNEYIPKPIDTDNIEIPEDIRELQEFIAKKPMKYGVKAGWQKGGPMGQNLIMRKRHIQA